MTRSVLAHGPAATPGWLCVLLLLCPVLAAGLDPSRAVTQYRADRWTRREGLPQMSVLAVLQDRAGYLWLGTQEGVARFDGLSFSSFKIEDTPELGSNYVAALFEDSHGRIWIGTGEGNVAWYDGGTFHRFPHGRGVRGVAVVGFAEGPGGELFVAFRGGALHRIAGDRLEPAFDSDGRPIERLGALAHGPGGEIWAGGEGSLFHLEGGGWTRYGFPSLPERRVTALAIHPDGDILLSEDAQTVRRMRRAGRSLEPVGPGWELPSAVRTLSVDRDRTVWIGTESGLARQRAGEEAVELWPGGPRSAVGAFFEDREGGLWIGTNLEGLLRLRADEVVPLGAPEGVPDDKTWNVMAAADGALWATSDGGLVRIAGGRVERIEVPGLPGGDGVALGERRDGSIWVGTYRHGLFRLPRDGEPLLHLTRAHGLPAGPITVVFEDSGGRLWVGSREGLAVERGARPGDGFRLVPLVEGAVQPYISAIVEDGKGALWIATTAGLFAHGRTGIRRFGVDGQAPIALNALLLDRGGRLWIGTNGRGVQVLDHGRLRTVDPRHGLPSTVSWIVEDERGGLWFSSNLGLFRADERALLRAARGGAEEEGPRRFGLGDGMREEECAGTGQPAGARTRDGRVWFPTGAGLVWIDPARLLPPVPPRPAVEEVVADGRSLRFPRAALDLAPGRGDVEIRFTALGFDEAVGTRFRYRLNGYDRAWIEAGQRRSAFYTRVAPGRYRFEVAALHDDGGSWSAPVALEFRLLPHFYETAWFRALLAALAGLALYAGIRGWGRHLERRAAESEAARQRAEQAQLKAEHLAREARRAAEAKGAFLATVSHELRTPLNGILGFSTLLLGSELDLRQREFIEIIRGSGETLLALVNQVLDISQSDRGKLALACEPFRVPDCFEEAVDLVAPAAAAKGLDLALAIESDAWRRAVGDRTRLREIANNLLANAVKFTESGGVLATVRARVEEERLVLELEVSDTGIGIAPENQGRIFQPFEQLDASLARRYGGAGLGLAIASRLCSWMDGTLGVESEPAKGSTFTATVRLDLDDDSAPAHVRLDGRLVLVAGLSGQTREAVERQLRSWGAEVCSDGRVGQAGGFAFGIGGAAEPGLPWIRLISPNEPPAPGSAKVDLLRPVRPSRLASAVCRVLDLILPSEPESPFLKEKPAGSPAISPSILIVEDDPVSRQLLYACLLGLGYTCDSACSGEDALEALEARPYDLLLLDIQMPGMDGFEVARRVRSRFGSHPRLVALTASAMEGDRERCLASGMDDYLSKPMRIEQLAAVLAESAGMAGGRVS
jgi:signal transduction histidine kinase/ligand-binding sensor domain-containing protein/CheY-like chemotaxis protein